MKRKAIASSLLQTLLFHLVVRPIMCTGTVPHITTDGAPAMVWNKNGFASLLVKHMGDLGHKQDIKTLHCIVHQEALCAKSPAIAEVMSVIVKAVNLVLSHTLNHRQFKDLLKEADAQ